MKAEFTDIGQSLVEQSKEVSSARGIVDELFPYIYVASKRMSARAISRWLEEEKKIKLSHVSISKALKKADQYFESILENILPFAQYAARELNVTVAQVLFEDECEQEIMVWRDKNQHPRSDHEVDLTNWDEALEAINKLDLEWFNYPIEVRAECSKLKSLYRDDDIEG